MSKQIIIDFYNLLCRDAKKGASGEKPIFLVAALRYVLESNSLGISLLGLLHPSHKRKIRPLFEYLSDRRLKKPEWSWAQLTDWNKAEMKKRIEEYTTEIADVNTAFSKLTRKEAKDLLDLFMVELRKLPELPTEI